MERVCSPSVVIQLAMCKEYNTVEHMYFQNAVCVIFCSLNK